MKTLLQTVTLVAFLATGVWAIQTVAPSKNGFTQSYSNLTDEQSDLHMLGKSFFRIPWVEAPSATTARDGLGPLFNANSCVSCHPNNAQGSVYTKDGAISRSMVVRLSVESNGSQEHKNYMQKQGFIPEKVYGAQLAINGIKDVPFEGKLNITYGEKRIEYPDGEVKFLRVPTYALTQLQYGKIDSTVAISVRKAPTLVGFGLIEQIPDEAILEHEDTDDKNHDGISGKANWVYSLEKQGLALGKYTYKASSPTVKNQIANAFFHDMSLTTSFHLTDNCTKSQKGCLNSPKANDAMDVPNHRLDAIDFYLKTLKIPVTQKKNKEGRALFEAIGCNSCHVSSFKIKDDQFIYPYSDFLLHDMGKELSDGRVEFGANKNEWRTTPLWGINSYAKAIGQRVDFLHDGRARTLEEAILWHGGEALNVKKHFMQLDKKQREQLIEFLGEL